MICDEKQSHRLTGEYTQLRILPRTGGYLSDLFALIAESSADLLFVINADAITVSAESMSRVIVAARQNPGRGLILPAVPVTDCYPQVDKPRLILGDRSLSRSGICVIRPELIHPNEQLLKRMKGCPALSELYLLGLWGVLGYVAQTLTVEYTLRRLNHALGCNSGIVVMDDPCLCHDVDRVGDLEFAMTVLREQGRLRKE